MAYSKTTLVDMLTVSEVAAWARVHPATVRRWIAAKRLKSIRIGHRMLVARRDLERSTGGVR